MSYPGQQALLLDKWTAEGIDYLPSCLRTAEADVLPRAATTVIT